MTRKFRPRSEPTGFNPSAGKKAVKPSAAPAIDVDSVLAMRVKAAYRHARIRFESLKAGEPIDYRVPRRYDGYEARAIDGDPGAIVAPGKPSAWKEIVRFCQARRINPEQYVRAAFQDISFRREAPEPRQLVGEFYANKWDRLKAKIDDKLALALKIQKEAVTAAIVYRQRVLKNEYVHSCLMAFGAGDIPLTPLFRYCMGASMEDEAFADLIEANEAQAVLQFECFRAAYKRVWGDLLPKGFSKMSKTVYPRLLLALGSAEVENHVPDE